VDPLALLQEKEREECAIVHHRVQEILIMLGISPKNLDVVCKYLWDLHKNLHKQVMIFKHRTIYKACVQTQYLENIGHNK